MRTDELRAELAELAREVDAFPENLGAVRRRVARRRVASASVALVIVAGLVAGGLALTRPAGHKLDVAGHPKSTTIVKLPRVDALVVLPQNASAGDVAQVRAILDATEAVEAYATVPDGDFTDTQDAGPLLSPTERAFAQSVGNSVIYGVEVARSVKNGEQALASALGSTAAVHDFGALDRRPAGNDVEIFMSVKASQRQIVAVSAALKIDPDVTSFRFLTHRDAYSDFKQLFSGQPDLIHNTTPKALPTSFDITVRDGVLPSNLLATYEHVPGVSTILVTANPLVGEAYISGPFQLPTSLTTP